MKTLTSLSVKKHF